MSFAAYDLIVIGGGLAGLAGATRAAELGLRVVLLEKGAGADYPCNSRYSGGILHLGFHDPSRDEAELVGVMNRLSASEADPALATALGRNGRRLVSWLQSHGVRFMRFNAQEAYRWCMAPPRALRAGLDWKDRGPDVTLRALTAALQKAGGAIRLGSEVTELRMAQGRCTGVVCLRDGAREEIAAAAVLIADGGFQSNRAMFETMIGGDFDAVFQRGAATGTGSGLRMAQAAGAQIRGTDRFYGHLLCADSRTNPNVWPYPELDAIATAGMVVDASGSRVADEGQSGVFLTNALARIKPMPRFFALFDAAIWEGPGTSARIPANPLLEQAGGTVLRASTPTELAVLMGVTPDRLEATVAEYNAAVAAGTLGALPVPRSTDVKPWPIAIAPFMAIPLCPGITYTMGGIATDGDARVLDTAGKPIPGLYAAGATTGGLEGGSRAAYIGGLMKAGTFGMIAAEHMAANRTGVSQSAAASPASAGAPTAPALPLPSKTSGLDRYPVIRATVRHGRGGTIAVAAAALLLGLWLAVPAYGAAGVALAVGIAALILFAGFSYVELIELITGLLLPD